MKLQLMADGESFRMEGSIDGTFQIIFEALELMAAGKDEYAPVAALTLEALMEQTHDWPL